MKKSSYRRILIFTGIVILITLAIQVYWNYKNYQAGKQHLINEVQISLDNAVEHYYASGAQKRTRITLQHARVGDNIRFIPLDSNPVKGDSELRNTQIKQDTFRFSKNQRFSPVQILGTDSLKGIDKIEVIKATSTNRHLDSLVGRIVLSLKQDTLDLRKMDSLVNAEFRRKEIGVDYGLLFKRNENVQQKLKPEILQTASLQTASESTWLPQNSSLVLYFTNETMTILKENLVGILLSAILILCVIGCLLFLLKVINDQKQLAEVKNDLISNITHEFKTPISTIKVALEGILFFNKENDREKTIDYVKASNLQVEKLNNMVEKLLETATLTGNQLKLNKEEILLDRILENLISKYKTLAPEKKFEFVAEEENILIVADPFHIENGFNNILDNAVKYGGEKITVTIEQTGEGIRLIFSDTGTSLCETEARQIFDKFYRVPKGNTHDVKGFGIGLYYTKEIIEKHGGSIKVEIKDNTRFIIFLPYGKN